MSLAKLEIHNVRNIERASLALSPSLNLIVGENGSGKTSLLEALYILGRGRSFRSTQANQIIKFNQDTLTVSGRTAGSADNAPTSIGVQLSRRTREMSISGKKVQSSAALISTLPVMLVQPTTVSLLGDAPKFRRRFLDLGAFHVEHDYLNIWRGYARALTHRNALLKSGNVRHLAIWDTALAEYGTRMANCRSEFFQRLRPYFLQSAQSLAGFVDVDLNYQFGWHKDHTLSESLKADLSTDTKMGYTHSGPHKADFSISVGGKPAKLYLSRGQLKLLVYALCQAQAEMLSVQTGLDGCFLVDDMASELDPNNRVRLLHSLSQRPIQLFITATNKDLFTSEQLQYAAVFHVEHGTITPS